MDIPIMTDEQKHDLIQKEHIKEYLIKDWKCDCLVNWARIQNQFNSNFVEIIYSIIIAKEMCEDACKEDK